MMNEKDIHEIIWKMTTALRGVIFTKDIAFTVARLLFLKYAVDNFVGARTVSEMQQCANAQKMFAMKDVESGYATISPVMTNIDNAYGFENILSSEENLLEYNTALFGADSRNQKKDADTEGFRRILEVLGQFDLAETDGSHFLGRSLTDALIDSIMNKDYRSMFRAEVTTGLQLSELAKSILDISENDCFCDFAAGSGISTIVITGNARPKTIVSDINPSVASVMAMLLIMYGYTEISLKCQDSLWKTDNDMHGNKIFADVPLNYRKKDANTRYSDSILAAVDIVVNEYLDEKGTAVLPIPSGFLFKRDKNTREVRNDLVNKGLLKAIIALPPMWAGAHIPTNLLVISSADYHKKVLLIDASNRGTRERNGNVSLSDNDMKLIVETVSNPTEIAGFSNVVSSDELKKEDATMLPSNYIEPVEEEESMTLAEIEAELEALYKSLR